MATHIDIFLRINIANSALICVDGADMHEFALFVIKAYLNILWQSAETNTGANSLANLQKIAQTVTTTHPYLFT